MANRIPVVSLEGLHDKLAAGDTIRGDCVQRSSDPENMLVLGADGGLFSRPTVPPEDWVSTTVGITGASTPAYFMGGGEIFTLAEVGTLGARSFQTFKIAPGVYDIVATANFYVAPSAIDDGTATDSYDGVNIGLRYGMIAGTTLSHKGPVNRLLGNLTVEAVQLGVAKGQKAMISASKFLRAVDISAIVTTDTRFWMGFENAPGGVLTTARAVVNSQNVSLPAMHLLFRRVD